MGDIVIVGVGGTTPGRADDRWGVAWCDYMFSHDLMAGLAQVGQSAQRRAGHLAGRARVIDGAFSRRAQQNRVLKFGATAGRTARDRGPLLYPTATFTSLLAMSTCGDVRYSLAHDECPQPRETIV
jgi:hypothetical protein